jgi:hypothetical protein
VFREEDGKKRILSVQGVMSNKKSWFKTLDVVNQMPKLVAEAVSSFEGDLAFKGAVDKCLPRGTNIARLPFPPFPGNLSG